MNTFEIRTDYPLENRPIVDITGASSSRRGSPSGWLRPADEPDAFGGPSRVNFDGEIVSDFEARIDGYSPSTAALVLEECYDNDISRHGWGFNVGGDASVFCSKNVGLGVMVRDSRAELLVPNHLQEALVERESDERVTIGRLHAVAGVRFRF